MRSLYTGGRRPSSVDLHGAGCYGWGMLGQIDPYYYVPDHGVRYDLFHQYQTALEAAWVRGSWAGLCEVLGVLQLPAPTYPAHWDAVGSQIDVRDLARPGRLAGIAAAERRGYEAWTARWVARGAQVIESSAPTEPELETERDLRTAGETWEDAARRLARALARYRRPPALPGRIRADVSGEGPG